MLFSPLRGCQRYQCRQTHDVRAARPHAHARVSPGALLRESFALGGINDISLGSINFRIGS